MPPAFLFTSYCHSTTPKQAIVVAGSWICKLATYHADLMPNRERKRESDEEGVNGLGSTSRRMLQLLPLGSVPGLIQRWSSRHGAGALHLVTSPTFYDAYTSLLSRREKQRQDRRNGRREEKFVGGDACFSIPWESLPCMGDGAMFFCHRTNVAMYRNRLKRHGTGYGTTYWRCLPKLQVLSSQNLT